MKLSNREKKLLIILLVIGVLFTYYKLVFESQADKITELKKKSEEYKHDVEVITNEISPDSKVRKEYKIMNEKISSLYKRFYPEIIQEKIIIRFDDMIKTSEIEAQNLSFNEPEINSIEENESKEKNEEYEMENIVRMYLGLDDKKTEEDNKKEKEVKIEKLSANLNFVGNYSKITSFLKQIEENEREILIKNLNLIKNEANELTGNMQLEIFAVPKLYDQDEDYLEWELFNEYGKDNPFYSNIQTHEITAKKEGEVESKDSAFEKIKSREYDFAMTVKPLNSDFSTIRLGKSNDRAMESFIYEDKNAVEDIEVIFDEKDGEYYFKYKSSSEKYPKDYDNGALFTPKGESINFLIFTHKRSQENPQEDMAGANIKLTNNTSKKVIVVIDGDDKNIPRVNIVKENGRIDIERY